ncbi:MAG: right-handed parallel beta-helix repeat-containing protein [bacterium]
MSGRKSLPVMIVIIVAGIICFCLIPLFQAHSNCDIYVDALADPNVEADGSATKPFMYFYEAFGAIYALDPNCSNPTISVQPGEYYESIYIYDTDNVTISSSDPEHPENTVIHNGVVFDYVSGCTLDGFTIAHSGSSGVQCWWDTNTVIKRCIIRENGESGIHIYGSNPKIINCIIWNNESFGIFSSGGGHGSILNSIIWANKKGSLEMECHMSDPDVRFCIVQGHTQMDPVEGIGIINVDPFFINADPKHWPPFDFRLQSIAGGFSKDSAAIDMGSSDGINRDYSTDIGVYQGYVRNQPMILPRREARNPEEVFQFFVFGGTSPYIWEVSDPNVASIDPNGYVTAIKPGHTWIKVTESEYEAQGEPALLVVKNPGDSYLIKEEPDRADLNAAYAAYEDTGDHLGIALTGLARCLDQPDPNIQALLDSLNVTYGGIFALDDPNLTYGPRKCWDMDANAPGLDAIQSAIQTYIIPCIETSISHLDMITDPNYIRFIGAEDGELFDDDNAMDDVVEVDFTEIALLKAGLHVTHAFLDVVSAYTVWDAGLDYCDLDDPFVDSNDEGMSNAVNDFLDAHPALFTILSGSGLPRMETALGHVQSAVDLVRDGIEALDTETDNQYDDLITRAFFDSDKEDEDEFWDTLNTLEQALDPNSAPAMVYLDELKTGTDCTPLEVDLSRFFLDPPDRDNLYRFNPNNEPDLDTIPDATFNGILPGMTLARLNGLILDDMDAWVWQQDYWDPNCYNVIEWKIYTEDLGELERITIYRSTEPCVDPNRGTPIVVFDYGSESEAIFKDGIRFYGEEYYYEGYYEDHDIGDCSQDRAYFYLVVAEYTGPEAELRSEILPIKNYGAFCDGDVSRYDGITPKDALCAFEKYLAASPTEISSCGISMEEVCCDVNDDYECTPRDALCIFRFYLQMPSCLDWYYWDDYVVDGPSLSDSENVMLD